MNAENLPAQIDTDNPPTRGELEVYIRAVEEHTEKRFKLPFLPLYIDEFMADTTMLDARAIGAYLSILMVLWRSDCRPIPNKTMLRRAARVARGFDQVWAEIGHHFIEDEKGFRNRKLEKIWRIATSKSLNKRHFRVHLEHRKSLKDNEAGVSNGGSNATPTQNPEELSSDNSIGRVRKKTRRSPSRALPQDWVPDMVKAKALMDELSLNRTEMNYCYQRMKDHAYANDRRQVDWDRAFNSWVRKAVNDGEVGPGSKARKADRNGGTAFNFEP